MRASWVLGLRHSHRNSRWRHRVPLAFPVLARGGGRWGRARSAGHQASHASPAPRAALIPARRAPERTRASRPRRGDLFPIRLDPMPAVRGYTALFAHRGLRGRRAGTRCRCAMVVVLSQPRWAVKGSDMSGNEAVTAADGDSAQGSARISADESQNPQLRGGATRPQKEKSWAGTCARVGLAFTVGPVLVVLGLNAAQRVFDSNFMPPA